MGKNRLEAFSDGVLAIIITIMVLELKVPHSPGFEALQDLVPLLLSYILSFVYVGIYWNNHHHMLHLVKEINGPIMWANLHLLFWLSLVPFATGWLGGNHLASAPAALYGVVLLMAALAYTILQTVIITSQGPNSPLARAVGKDLKGRLSIALYAVAIPLAFVSPAASDAVYALVAFIWIIPDKRIEHTVVQAKAPQ